MNKTIFTKGNIIILISIFAFMLVTFGAFFGTYKLKKAHSSFETYSAYLDCTKTFDRTLTTGICLLPTGEKIKLLKADNGRWYKNGSFTFP
jgi:hypothetical protein